MKQAADKRVPTTQKNVNEVASLGQFGSSLFDIGWRLAVAVVVFLWGGSVLDKKLGTEPWLTIVGFFLVIFSFVLIVRQILHNIPRKFGGLKND